MKPALRAVALGTLLSVLVAAGFRAYPVLGGESEADISSVIECQNRIAEAERGIREADREDELVMRRISVRQEVIRDVVAGRLTFAAAAGQFAELNREHAAALNYVRRAFPGRTDEERAAWQLAAQMRHSDDPAARALGEEWECVLTSRL